MTVLVVGGTGFLGGHLLRRLAHEDVTVRAYGRRRVSEPEKVDYIYGDLFDRSRLRRALEGVDCVFHFAWSTVPQTSIEDPQADVQGNLVAGIGLLDACLDAGVQTVVFPSSGGTVYGPASGDGIVTEDHPTDPISSYGITKLALEKFLVLYRHLHGLDYRILRISNAYGEGQQADRPQGLIGVVLQQIATGRPVHVWGDGTVVRDYIYAGDAIDCCLRAARTPLPETSPRIFNVGSEQGHSVSDVLAAISRVTGWEPVVHYSSARAFDVPRSVLSSRRARQVLGWEPRTTLEEGIARSWRWVVRAAATEGDGSRAVTLD